jgi:hypothetical protein
LEPGADLEGAKGKLSSPLDFEKLVFLDNTFGNLSPSKKILVPLDCLIILIEKK